MWYDNGLACRTLLGSPVTTFGAETMQHRRPLFGRFLPSRRASARLAACLGFVLLVTASILFRLPALINADGVHSDAAVIGLQARHILAGEWSWFVWGTNYQGALDPLLTAVAFAIAGATPLTLMVVPLIGHLLLTWFVFDVLCKGLGLASALVATLPLVFAPHAINGVALYPPRQWCITAVFAAIWLLDGASTSWRPTLRYAVGAALAVLTLYLDLFAVQFVAGLGLFALACCFDGGARGVVLRRAVACVLGTAISCLLVLRLYQLAPQDAPWSQTARISLAQVRYNAGPFWHDGLPWVLSSKVYVPGPRSVDLSLWVAPAGLRMIQVVGATSFMVGLLSGGAMLFMRRVPWGVRRLGGLGFVIAVSSIAGFLMSPAAWVAGPWGARYLAPIIWAAPLALAPVAYLLRTKRFAATLAMYLVAAGVAGWIGFGPYVRGPLPVRAQHGAAQQEAQLAAFLRQRGITYAAAEYWLAYRLTFLWAEQPVVIPLMPVDGDRYRPYQRGFDAASDVALIFHPYAPHAPAAAYARRLEWYGVRYERRQLGEFTVFILHKQPCAYLPPLGRPPSC